MSEADQPEDFNPFKGMPIFGDLGKLFAKQASSKWETAREIAIAVAIEDGYEPNVDPIDRRAIEQLTRIAELQVADITGLSTVRGGEAASIIPSTRSSWATATIKSYKPLLEPIGEASYRSEPREDPLSEIGDPTSAMIGRLMKMIGPTLTSMTAGSMIGNLATRSLGQYDLPIPRKTSQILVIPANIHQLTKEWNLDLIDLYLWVCLSELTHHAVLSIPHVQKRMLRLLNTYVSNFETDATALQDRIRDFDLDDPKAMTSLESLWGDPEVMLGTMQSPTQREILPNITALVSVIAGYVDWVMDSIGRDIISSYPQLSEALRRRRVSTTASHRFIEQMLGLELNQNHYDKGTAFVTGVLDRADTDGLARLWNSARELPTPAEVEAPGLWLARIDLPD